jgi:hypothetical protein
MLYDQPEERDMPREFTFSTQRTITVTADTLAEAERLVEAELHDNESIISCDDEDGYENTPVAEIEP